MSPAATTQLDLGKVRFLPLRYDSGDSQASALKLIHTLVPEWSTGDSRVELVRFTDGITNTLLKASNHRPGLSKSDVDRESILLRAYGNGTAVLIDREREAANHELLMRHHLAPELLARFENGMLYRFVPGIVAQPKDLSSPSLAAAVARRLAEWHATVPYVQRSSPQANEKPNGVANGKPSDSTGNGQSNKDISAASSKLAPNLWTTLQKWIHALPTDSEKQRERQALLQRELHEIVQQLSQRSGLGHNGLVFAHCDLLSANIIIHRGIDEAITEVSFIDYEYATPSPAAFDIANHFAEWAGYDCDYSAMPSVAQRHAFISEYMKTYVDLSGDDLDESQETHKLMDEVNLFRGVPGFYWGVWALIQATISEIDFDYASYAEERLGEYWAFKAEQDGSRQARGDEMPLREQMWARSK